MANGGKIFAVVSNGLTQHTEYPKSVTRLTYKRKSGLLDPVETIRDP